MDNCLALGGADEPQGQVVQGGGQLPSARGVGQGRAAGKPSQTPGCFLLDMLVVAAEGLVDVEQEDKVFLQMGLLAYMLEQYGGCQKLKIEDFFCLLFIRIGNAIRSKKNTSKTVFDQSIPLG